MEGIASLSTIAQVNSQLTEQLLNMVNAQAEEIKLLKAEHVKQKEVLDLTYQEVKRLRKKIDSFLMW